MKAMILEAPGQLLQWRDVPDPVPGPGEVLVKVAACGVCRTDLHVVDGDLTEPRLPIIPGHEIVGRVETTGAGVLQFARRRSGRHSVAGAHLWPAVFFAGPSQENLCNSPLFTGYQINGGYATTQLRRLLLLSAARELRGCVRGAAVVCGADRPSRAAHDGGCQGARHLRLWRGRAYRRPGCATRAAIGLRLHPPGDSKAQRSPAVSAACGPEAPTSIPAPPWMRQSSLRPSATWYPGRWKRSEKAAPSSSAGFT